MVRFPLLMLSALALAACSSQAPDQSGDADDFASRIGSGSSSPEGQAQQSTTAVDAAPYPGTDVKQLEQLGNVSNVDLGPRTGGGGCTFSHEGTTMLMAAAPGERALPGKATVRVGGQLLLLDAPPGGFDLVRTGTTFNGEGFSVLVSPTGPDTGTMTVTDTEGAQKTYNGRWVCS